MSDAQLVLALHRRVAALKEQTRRGWELRGVPSPESVADHSLGVALLAAALAPGQGLDPARVVTMAALHDLCEAVCGDIIPADQVLPEEKLRRERAAMEQVLAGLPGRDELLELWLDTAMERTEEGRLVKELDTLEMVLQADHYEARDGLELEEFLRAGERLQISSLQEVVQALHLRRAARTLFEHLACADDEAAADLIIGFGVFHMSVPEQCARLHALGAAPKILFTGGVGAGSGDLGQPEALAFRSRALELGVPEEAILTEPDSTNTLENVLASHRLLEDKGVQLRSAILVALPHRQRRVWLTSLEHLPEVKLTNAPPPLGLDQSAEIFGGLDLLAPQLIGEVARIKRYGEQGDIRAEAAPEGVARAEKLLSGED